MILVEFTSLKNDKVRLIAHSRAAETLGKTHIFVYHIDIMPAGFDGWYTFRKVIATTKRGAFSKSQENKAYKLFKQIYRNVQSGKISFDKFDLSKCKYYDPTKKLKTI